MTATLLPVCLLWAKPNQRDCPECSAPALLSLLGRFVRLWHTCSTDEPWGPFVPGMSPGRQIRVGVTASALRRTLLT